MEKSAQQRYLSNSSYPIILRSIVRLHRKFKLVSLCALSSIHYTLVDHISLMYKLSIASAKYGF